MKTKDMTGKRFKIIDIDCELNGETGKMYQGIIGKMGTVKSLNTGFNSDDCESYTAVIDGIDNETFLVWEDEIEFEEDE
jgi:hypothetical protein